MKIDYSGLPIHMQSGARRYVEDHIEPGSFLRSVLENDCVAAFARADAINAASMRDWAGFLYNLPRDCWGSPETVDAWLKGRKND